MNTASWPVKASWNTWQRCQIPAPPVSRPATLTAVPAEPDAVAAVVFEAPHGTDGYLISSDMGPSVAFGRGGDCPIRFGYAPRLDPRLPRRAGALVLADGLVAVQSSESADHPAIQVRTEGRAPVELREGDLYAPAAVEFVVVARGREEWPMTVRVRRPSAPGNRVRGGGDDVADPTTERRRLDLSEHERAVLAAYLAPLRAGQLEPATHADVAAALHFSANKVRGDLYDIWAKMVAGGVPVLPYSDRRMAVTQAALHHGLAP
jgi:hypothetical protein